MLNGRFWQGYMRRVFIPQLEALSAWVVGRLLPAFEPIDDEATAVAKQTYDDLLNEVTDPDMDISSLAEQARDAGLRYYQIADGVRQGLLNVAAVWLYHLFEQQLLAFLRKELLTPWEEDERALLKVGEFRKRLASHGMEVEGFTDWVKVDELRLLSNAIKHGDGGSVDKIKVLRPDLFSPPEMDGPRVPAHQVVLPLIGEDVFLTAESFKDYSSACIGFIEELSDRLASSCG